MVTTGRNPSPSQPWAPSRRFTSSSLVCISRKPQAPTLGVGDPLPARPRAVRRGTKAAVELARAPDRADDRVERDALKSEISLAHAPERLDHLVERQYHLDVARLAPESPRQLRER